MNRMFRVIFIVICAVMMLVSVTRTGYALEKIDRFVIGEVVKIKSKVLGEDRIVFVHYPRGYSNSWERYPVLYVMDGIRCFPVASSMVRFLSEAGHIPHMIVVGVTNVDPIRDLTLSKIKQYPNSGGAEKFVQFLKTELIPEIDKNYRTKPYRVMAGHSLAGLLATYIMLKQPGTFNAFIAASPFMEWDNRWFLKTAGTMLKKHTTLNNYYYFSLANEPQLEKSLDIFKQLLQAGVPEKFTWKFDDIKNEDHESTFYSSLYKGIRWLYFGWKLPDRVMGSGLDGVKDHYLQLSKRYGYEINPPSKTLNDLGFRFMDMKRYPQAIDVYQYCIKLYPNFWMAYHNLGYCHQQQGDNSKAIFYYEKSLKLNPKNTTAAQRIKELKK